MMKIDRTEVLVDLKSLHGIMIKDDEYEYCSNVISNLISRIELGIIVEINSMESKELYCPLIEAYYDYLEGKGFMLQVRQHCKWLGKKIASNRSLYKL